ncbi:MAG: hypothetical protein WCI67_08340 [Chloroflexales bacterium]
MVEVIAQDRTAMTGSLPDTQQLAAWLKILAEPRRLHILNC